MLSCLIKRRVNNFLWVRCDRTLSLIWARWFIPSYKKQNGISDLKTIIIKIIVFIIKFKGSWHQNTKQSPWIVNLAHLNHKFAYITSNKIHNRARESWSTITHFSSSSGVVCDLSLLLVSMVPFIFYFVLIKGLSLKGVIS